MKIVINVPDYPLLSEGDQVNLGRIISAHTVAWIHTSIGVKFLDDDAIDDAIETAISHHWTLPDVECSCGTKNNMDGDVLHSHRFGVISSAVDDLISVTPTV